jgi:hypothetical protein
MVAIQKSAAKPLGISTSLMGGWFLLRDISAYYSFLLAILVRVGAYFILYVQTALLQLLILLFLE